MTTSIFNKQKKWMRWTTWLVLAFSFAIAPIASMAAPLEPQVFGPSSYLPMLRNNVCRGTRSAANIVGTQVYGATGYNQSHFGILQNTQTAWLRNSVLWVEVEPNDVAPNAYDWSSTDARLRAAVQNCANIIATIDEAPAWAATNGRRSPIKASALNDFREFVVALVERYDGDGGPEDAPNGAVVKYWEFYNEPDFSISGSDDEGWGNYGAEYAKMLETVYAPVKAADPDAKVVFGGIAHNLFTDSPTGGLFVRNFLPDVLAAGGGAFFDIMNFHYYPFQHNRSQWTQTDASGLPEKYAAIKKYLTDAGVNKPFMITEIGWHSGSLDPNPNYPSSEEYQARRVLELIVQSKSLGVMNTIWWALEDLGPAFTYRTGLAVPGNPPTLKPAYQVYVEAVKRVGKSTYIGAVATPTVNNDLEAYRFIRNGTNQDFYVAWLNPTVLVSKDQEGSYNNNLTQNLKVDGASAKVYNKDGTLKQSLSDGDDGANDGKITVTVGRSPIYIEIK